MTDSLTQTLIEMAIGNATRDLTLAESSQTHLLVTGKSARLLKTGDVVAVRELTKPGAEPSATGVAHVTTAFPSRMEGRRGSMRVVTDQGVFTVPASRLLVVHHPADPFETLARSTP